VKFQNVTTLTIFIEDNQGDEETTKLQKIVVCGTAGETFNVAEIKKIEDH
jgi:PITH domain